MATMQSQTSDVNGTFQLVHRKQRNRKGKRAPTSSHEHVLHCTDDIIDVDKHSIAKRIGRYRTDITVTDFYKQLLCTVGRAVESQTQSVADEDSSQNSVVTVTPSMHPQSTPVNPLVHAATGTVNSTGDCMHKGVKLDMLVYGLGNFVSCVIARYQLALLLALRDHWHITPKRCQVYDPKFTTSEKDILSQLGCTVIDKNEEGKRVCEHPTLVLMPHCGKALFNNFLWANWTPQHLRHLVVIGNSFSAMLDSLPERLWKSKLPYIATICPYTREEVVENTFTHMDIFNDMSVHWFPTSSLQAAPSQVWTKAEEPVYSEDGLEIIVDALNKL